MKKKIYHVDVNNKVVFLRADFNVPLKDGEVKNAKRITAELKTIQYLLDNNAKIVIASHLGKVKHSDPEKKIEDIKKNNMAFVAPKVSELVGKQVKFIDATRGDEVANAVKEMQPKDIILLQNTRYEVGEEKNDAELSSFWASLADVYCNDAFGTCHRAHASTYGVAEVMKQQGKPTCIGYLVEKEVDSLGKCISGYQTPYIVVLGGSKVSDKIKMIEGLLPKAEKVLIGGAMSYTFLKALGHNVGKSLVEDDRLEYAKDLYERCNDKIVLPVDHLLVDDIANPTIIKNSNGIEIDDGLIAVDVGEETKKLYASIIENAKTIFWNGPMGIFEDERYASGTKFVCETIGNTNCFSVIGGGDSATAVEKFKYEDKFSHVSTGGGASAELIENDGHLPGIDIIDEE